MEYGEKETLERLLNEQRNFSTSEHFIWTLVKVMKDIQASHRH